MVSTAAVISSSNSVSIVISDIIGATTAVLLSLRGGFQSYVVISLCGSFFTHDI